MCVATVSSSTYNLQPTNCVLDVGSSDKATYHQLMQTRPHAKPLILHHWHHTDTPGHPQCQHDLQQMGVCCKEIAVLHFLASLGCSSDRHEASRRRRKDFVSFPQRTQGLHLYHTYCMALRNALLLLFSAGSSTCCDTRATALTITVPLVIRLRSIQ